MGRHARWRGGPPACLPAGAPGSRAAELLRREVEMRELHAVTGPDARDALAGGRRAVDLDRGEAERLRRLAAVPGHLGNGAVADRDVDAEGAGLVLRELDLVRGRSVVVEALVEPVGVGGVDVRLGRVGGGDLDGHEGLGEDALAGRAIALLADEALPVTRVLLVLADAGVGLAGLAGRAVRVLRAPRAAVLLGRLAAVPTALLARGALVVPRARARHVGDGHATVGGRRQGAGTVPAAAVEHRGRHGERQREAGVNGAERSVHGASMRTLIESGIIPRFYSQREFNLYTDKLNPRQE